MSVLDDVLGSLRAMSQVQLLLAFVACTGYALAQGSLLNAKARRIAWTTTGLAALGFAIESSEWMYAAMLVVFAIVGLGAFIASTWLLSRALGFSKPRALAEAVEFAESVDVAESGLPSTFAQPSRSASMLPPHSEHAHLA